METLEKRVEAFMEGSRPFGAIIDGDQCLALAVDAALMYAAYGELSARSQQRQEYQAAKLLDYALAPPVPVAIDKAVKISESEWGVIKPLWLLYMERERAQLLEATKMMGDVGFGRDSISIEQEITAAEEAMHMKAFSQSVITI